ncbi:hypothetical protein CO151_08480 [bacterium CG_4_9_14_3_um_filter_65_15]|nr:MAG: hypothetical protein CO151_08480 [bacterium CG_4_9_14_3_um_filter_65_15]
MVVKWQERPVGGALVSSGDADVGLLLRGGVIIPAGDRTALDVGAFLSSRSRLDPFHDSKTFMGGINLVVGFY